MSSTEEWQDVLGSGAVMKQIIRNGNGVCPEFKQDVIVHVLGKRQNEQIFLNTREGQPIKTSIGDQILDFLPPGVMLCVRMMKEGELARCKVQSRYAYASAGVKFFNLEPDEDVEFEVELLQIGELSKEVPEMTQDEIANKVIIFKNRGNEFFEYGEYEKALRCYKEGVRFGDGAVQDDSVNLPDDAPVLRDRVSCLNNIATVLEKQGKLKEAMETTVLVLQSDPKHLKSLVRAARVAVLQGSHEEAQAAVNAAWELAPTNAAVIKVKKDLDDRITKYKQFEKETYGGFLKPVKPEEIEKIRQKEAEMLEEFRRQKNEETTVMKTETKETTNEVINPLNTMPQMDQKKMEDEGDDEEEEVIDDEDAMYPKDQPDAMIQLQLSNEWSELFTTMTILFIPSLLSVFAYLLYIVIKG